MTYKPSDERTAGIDLDGSRLYAASLIFEKGAVKLQSYFKTDFTLSEHETDVNPLYTDSDLALLRRMLSENLAVTGLNANDILVRRMRLKLVREKDIDEVFAFQAEPLLPFPLENGIIDKMVVEKQEGSTLLSLLAIRKDYLKKHFDLLEKLRIDPEIVSSVPLALAAFASFFTNSEEPLFVVHIGFATSACVLVKQGRLLASHGSKLGVKSLMDAYQQDVSGNAESFSSFDFSQFTPEKFPHLSKAFDLLAQEMAWKVIAETKETKLKENPSLLITGEGSSIDFLHDKIKTALSYPLAALEKKDFFDLDDGSLRTYAVAIGLALAAQPKMNQGINFRQHEFTYSKPWRRFQKPLLIYAGLALLLAAAFYIFGQAYLSYGQDKLKERYLSMLAMIQKPYEEFERNYEAKHPNERRGEDDTVLPIQELNQEDLEHRLDFLEKEIRAMPDTYPLNPNTPRVSDVLAWLSTHPKVVCKEEDKDKEDCAPIKIESFNYTLTKRPEQNKRNEKYQARVDLEFSTSSPRIAREFHDALIAPNELIDPKGEVKWSSNRGKYRTSFFLKDRTQYPSPLRE